MISYDFEYYRPESISEAVNIFEEKASEGKKPLYYGGGTEIVTFARKKTLVTGAVVDLKEIPEVIQFSEDGDRIIYGAGLSLNEIIDRTSFKLMAQVARKIADHTVRNKLTLGGNICGRLFYREAVLPLLVAEAQVVLATGQGSKKLPIIELFQKRMQLKPGEFILNVEVDKKYLDCPFYAERKEKQTEIDYPLFHLVALKDRDYIRFAFSGLLSYPLRSSDLEEILNNRTKSMEDRADLIIENLPAPIRDDLYGSSDFRKFLFKNAIVNCLKNLEGDE